MAQGDGRDGISPDFHVSQASQAGVGKQRVRATGVALSVIDGTWERPEGSRVGTGLPGRSEGQKQGIQLGQGGAGPLPLRPEEPGRDAGREAE